MSEQFFCPEHGNHYQVWCDGCVDAMFAMHEQQEQVTQRQDYDRAEAQRRQDEEQFYAGA